jgi:calcineurin-like phosphoesterase family protein
VFTDEQLSPYFHTIVPEGQGIEMDIGGIPCYITHYPTETKIDRFNLVGHIHGAWKYQLNMLNIGVDVHHFHPVNLDTIPFHYKAVCEFYDNDVWVAYDPINASHRTARGKKNSYFRP